MEQFENLKEGDIFYLVTHEISTCTVTYVELRKRFLSYEFVGLRPVIHFKSGSDVESVTFITEMSNHCFINYEDAVIQLNKNIDERIEKETKKYEKKINSLLAKKIK